MTFTRKTVLGMFGAAALGCMTALPALAQDVTLRMHQFLPDQANVPKLVLYPWADRIEAASNGRIKIERYGSMQLGGSPPELMDQAIDGVADIVWTVVGYTPGRYPTTEVLELPFMMTDARAMSSAYWQMFEKYMKDGEFKDVKILGTWVHGPGMLHSKDPVTKPGDMEGLKIRGGSRLVNELLKELGATPVGLPVPGIPEALSKGVIDGTTIPWEVTGSLKVPELVKNHTEFEGAALYTLGFVLAMNKDRYDSLDPELQKIIDDNSGLEFSILAGGTQADSDGPSRQAAVDAGNNIITVSGDDVQAWKDASQPIYDGWIADMETKGIDGQALIDEARALMDAYGQ
ncbi:TRAP-type C4-dicarboxylate transport system substrate-binding protein [Sulfitobacter undariae]|uniref:TRAP-type C4-dicarboxylate transport system substrate-binding protein n=1 Tax=Sulfitobacter undariae TaxID=1563671 RepID=A0A7W6E1F1_9RHOB|nr:TRAP transporter substrate-binding protein [Sulfitobacter undariae]MBB3992589.1 TRAP-type C4-dicarboxylate transport system substrate-binding protein [Sulfitobacter undariae]